MYNDGVRGLHPMQKDGHQRENQHEGSIQLACNLLWEETDQGRLG